MLLVDELQALPARHKIDARTAFVALELGDLDGAGLARVGHVQAATGHPVPVFDFHHPDGSGYLGAAPQAMRFGFGMVNKIGTYRGVGVHRPVGQGLGLADEGLAGFAIEIHSADRAAHVNRYHIPPGGA